MHLVKVVMDELGNEQLTLDDEVRLLMAKGDRRKALDLLCRRLGNDVYAFARSMLNDDAQAEDVRQQVFFQAWRDLDTFEGRASVKTWILGITKYRCLDALKVWRRWMARLRPATEEDDKEFESQPDVDLDRAVYCKSLLDCLYKLRPEVRIAVCLKYSVEDMTYEQVAVICKKKTGAMQATVARALPRLKRCLERRLRGKVMP